MYVVLCVLPPLLCSFLVEFFLLSDDVQLVLLSPASLAVKNSLPDSRTSLELCDCGRTY